MPRSYTFKDFERDFPNEEACLEHILRRKYPDGKWYRVRGRKSYVDSKGKQIHPLKGTIFEKSSTPLRLWFYAIFLFSMSKNGVAAKELQRHLGVTYKTAWRMCKKIRVMMKEETTQLEGVVEADETFIGGYRPWWKKDTKPKIPVLGIVERGGRVKAYQLSNIETHLILQPILKDVKKGSTLFSDQHNIYTKIRKMGYTHDSINHGRKEYVRGNVHTNTIEGFWGQLKRSLDGTYHSVSKQHLQSYVDEFSLRYNHRRSSIFPILIQKI